MPRTFHKISCMLDIHSLVAIQAIENYVFHSMQYHLKCQPLCMIQSSLCDPMDCSLLGSSVRGILQARILEWVSFPSLGDLLNPGIKPTSPALADRFFTTEPPGQPKNLYTKFQTISIVLQHIYSWANGYKQICV